MNVFMLYDFMIFLIFSSHIICTKTTIDHRLLELLPRFQWETPCTGQGWHCLRQWLKRVRPVRQLSHGFSEAQFIDQQLGSKFTAPITDTIFEVFQVSKQQRWQYLAMPAWVTHVTHVTHLGEESAARKPVLYLLSVKSLDCQIRKTTQWSLFRCEELKSACMMHVFTT